MYVNNPSYTMKLADLLDLYKDNFNYEDLYKIVSVWLSSEKVYFFKDDDTLWNNFIQAFCDRFYSRNMNFYTTLDFKLKLRDVLRSCKNRATRVYESELLKINPLKTFSHSTEHTRNDNGKSENSNLSDTNDNVESESISTVNNENNSTSTNYSLHSDTPSNAVNIDDLFSVAKNFVTDADNNKSSGNSKEKTNASSSDKSKRINLTNSKSESEFVNESLFNELSEGYDGNTTDLIEKYMRLKTDVIQFYLDEIENACLFSSILY